MTLGRFKEEIEHLDDTLDVVILCGGVFYSITDVDHTRDQLEITVDSYVEPK